MKPDFIFHSRSGLGTKAATDAAWCLDKRATQHYETVNLQQQSRQQNYLHPANARFIDLIKGTKGERQRLEITENQAPEKLQWHHQGSILSTQHSPVCHLFYSSCTECYLRRKESFLLKRSPCQEVWHTQRKRSHIHAEASFGQLSLLQQAHVRGLCIPPLCGCGVCHRTHTPGSRLLHLCLCFCFRVEKRPLKCKSIVSQSNIVFLSQQAALTHGFGKHHNCHQPPRVHKPFLTPVLTWYMLLALTERDEGTVPLQTLHDTQDIPPCHKPSLCLCSSPAEGRHWGSIYSLHKEYHKIWRCRWRQRGVGNGTWTWPLLNGRDRGPSVSIKAVQTIEVRNSGRGESNLLRKVDVILPATRIVQTTGVKRSNSAVKQSGPAQGLPRIPAVHSDSS